ncbi:MAG: aminopeptidase N, partial [Proteobacteria bacterium]|nr:aminopeptidase N [Pseudomonadota bacterium]
MANSTIKTKYLKDYKAFDYEIKQLDLNIELFQDYVLVTGMMDVRIRNSAKTGQSPFICDGLDLELISIDLDGSALEESAYKLDKQQLTLLNPPKSFQLTTRTKIYPNNNYSLEGLYRSNDMYCTQCEAEGFRSITYFPDRPDVMTHFITTIIADKDLYPILLSNGNPTDKGDLPDNRHWVKWEDPFRKPTYLFAVVAGDLKIFERNFRTCSGRDIKLQIFVEPENIDKCDHAMSSLKKAMWWDEEQYGREYDLDIYMIVAVNDFNFGAMENKGLNIFNAAYVLARPDTATDLIYERIEGVIGHEYFHNWTGNRITCRDWFQLSLKEGLTVFRDQQFTSDNTSKTVKRIQDVDILRTIQFAEDAGGMAHPVRPDSYIEIDNFYSVTIYEKGAEVIRMIFTLLGEKAFKRGMDLYFERFDGQAITTEDFIHVMEESSGLDLAQFRRWYSQAGTPEVRATGSYDKKKQIFTLSLQQQTPPTPGQKTKQPLHIPIIMGLLGADGAPLRLNISGKDLGT